MALTTKEIIASKSPSFAADARLDDFIEIAGYTVSSTAFGTKYNYAVALVVLHMLTLDAMSGGSSNSSGSGVAGGIHSEKEGDLSRSYGNTLQGINGATLSDSYFAQTQFGNEYLYLKRTCFPLPRTRIV
jgi:hypothetical protein